MAWANFLGLSIVDGHINGNADGLVLYADNVAFRLFQVPAYGVQGGKPFVIGIGVLRHPPADRGIPAQILRQFRVIFTEQRDKFFRRGEVKYGFHAIRLPLPRKKSTHRADGQLAMLSPSVALLSPSVSGFAPTDGARRKKPANGCHSGDRTEKPLQGCGEKAIKSGLAAIEEDEVLFTGRLIQRGLAAGVKKLAGDLRVMDHTHDIKTPLRVLYAVRAIFRPRHVAAYGVQGGKLVKIRIRIALRNLASPFVVARTARRQIRGINRIVFAEQFYKLFRRGKVKYCFHATRIPLPRKKSTCGADGHFQEAAPYQHHGGQCVQGAACGLDGSTEQAGKESRQPGLLCGAE